MKKILIAGTNSGVGKTTISLGIMQALVKRNMKVQPYKVENFRLYRPFISHFYNWKTF